MIDDKTFNKLAKMSALHFNENEKDSFMKELANIEEFLKQLDKIDFEEIDIEEIDIKIIKKQKEKKRHS